MTKIVLVSPSYDYKKIDNSYNLLTDIKNYVHGGKFYTSLADVTLVDLIRISKECNSFTLDENGFNERDNLYTMSKELVNYVNTVKSNLVLESPFIERDLSSGEHPTLWIFGCSHSNAYNLPSIQDSYGYLLAKKFNYKLKIIAKDGSSVHWAIRHIVNSNFKNTDFIIWQITNPVRISYYSNQLEEVILSTSKHRSLVDAHDYSHSLFMHFSFINLGVQYLRSLNATFLLTTVDCIDIERLDYYSQYPEYFYPSNFDCDRTTDGNHYGVNSQRNLANILFQCCYEKINQKVCSGHNTNVKIV